MTPCSPLKDGEIGSTTSKYLQIADCVMPAVAAAVGHALNAYFEAIPSLYDPLPHLGYREVLSITMHRERKEDAELPLSTSSF